MPCARAYRRRATRSDLWRAYAEVFPACTHKSQGKQAGDTNHLERWHYTVRQRLGRLVRNALSVSKCKRIHQAALDIFIHEHNLSVKG